MEILIIEDEGRGHGRGRRRGRGWLNEDFTERDSGEGWGRTSFCGNGRGQDVLQRTVEYNRQDRNWLTSTHVEGRIAISGMIHKCPPNPVPSRFSDWSSLGSPCARTSPHSSLDIRVEQNENIQNRLSGPSAVETRPERVRTSSPEEVDISPQTDQQRDRSECSCSSRTYSGKYRSQEHKEAM